jgi:hypothetical protein
MIWALMRGGPGSEAIVSATLPAAVLLLSKYMEQRAAQNNNNKPPEPEEFISLQTKPEVKP